MSSMLLCRTRLPYNGRILSHLPASHRIRTPLLANPRFRILCRRQATTSTVAKDSAPTSPDVLIIGSGAAALTAALRAKWHGLFTLVIEKTSHVGGTTSYSGGALWIPNSGIHPKSVSDSFEEALKYMQTTIDVSPTKSSSLARKTAFLENGPRMVKFLANEGFKWQASLGYPDYYPLMAGGKVTGRSIEGKVFDLKKLGDWQTKIRMSTIVPFYPVYTYEAGEMFRAMSGSSKALFTAMNVAGPRMKLRQLFGQVPVTMGMTLVAQLLYLCLKKEVPILLNSGLKELIVENGLVTGAVVLRDGKKTIIEAKKGVILAAGGFSRNTAMRKEFQEIAGAASKTLTSPEDKGDAISAAIKAGVATELMDEAWWGPTIVDNEGNAHWLQYERALPHAIIVDQKGKRFLNESESYTRLIHNLFAHQKKTGVAIPAFLILDSNHRDKYLLVDSMPKKLAQASLDSGMIVKANTLEELARKLGIDWSGLHTTAERFNGFAKSGIDEDFQRGVSPHDQFFGDPFCKPNPNVGAITKAPFYGAKIMPGDLGTKGGVLTDEHARALRDDGSVVKGLYVVGNSSASVMGKEYIGAGGTLGPGLTFAFVAADDIAKS